MFAGWTLERDGMRKQRSSHAIPHVIDHGLPFFGREESVMISVSVSSIFKSVECKSLSFLDSTSISFL